jgi:hypothetical protein
LIGAVIVASPRDDVENGPYPLPSGIRHSTDPVAVATEDLRRSIE